MMLRSVVFVCCYEVTNYIYCIISKLDFKQETSFQVVCN